MYQVRPKEPYFPAQPDGDILKTTVGGLLRGRSLTVLIHLGLQETRKASHVRMHQALELA